VGFCPVGMSLMKNIVTVPLTVVCESSYFVCCFNYPGGTLRTSLEFLVFCQKSGFWVDGAVTDVVLVWFCVFGVSWQMRYAA